VSGGHTPGPWFAGCQNDALYVIAGRAPAINNDAPWHDAPRVALAKVYGPAEGDCLPVNADANARLIAAAPELLKACSDWIEWLKPNAPWRHDAADYEAQMLDAMRSAIAKATGAA
jgi:hypothetical protein